MSARALPHWLVGGFLSTALHASLIGGWLAFVWAMSLLSPQPAVAMRHGPLVIAELVTRAPPPPVEPKVNRGAPETPSPPVVDSTASAGDDGYFARLRLHLAGFLPPPRQGLAPGVAQVRIRIGESGELDGVSLARSSGSTVLDQEALELVARAAPVPRPPQAMAVLVPVEVR
jgi:TonB family protein